MRSHINAVTHQPLTYVTRTHTHTVMQSYNLSHKHTKVPSSRPVAHCSSYGLSHKHTQTGSLFRPVAHCFSYGLSHKHTQKGFLFHPVSCSLFFFRSLQAEQAQKSVGFEASEVRVGAQRHTVPVSLTLQSHTASRVSHTTISHSPSVTQCLCLSLNL